MTDQQHILRAEHDADQGGEDGYMEVVARISGDPRSYPISVPEDVIDSVIDLYMRLWGVNPDRIYRLKGNVPADLDEGYVEPRELIWPDYAFEWPDPPVFSPPDFLDRLELQKELRAEREPATFDPSDPENMATEQLIERIEELEESRKILLSQRARLASTNDALQDELNLASQAAQKDAMASGRQQITLSRQLADAGVAADHAHQIACERENELERTNGTLSAQIACLEKENADGKANRSQQAAQILALDDVVREGTKDKQQYDSPSAERAAAAAVTEQLIERIDELKEAMEYGDLEFAGAAEISRDRISQLERTNQELSDMVIRLENENAAGQANRNQQTAQILALDDNNAALKAAAEANFATAQGQAEAKIKFATSRLTLLKTIEELDARILMMEATCGQYEERVRVGLGAAAEQSINSSHTMNDASNLLEDLNVYCSLLEKAVSKKQLKRLRRKWRKLRPVQLTGFPPLIPNDDVADLRGRAVRIKEEDKRR